MSPTYLTHIKTMLVEAVKKTFDQDFPEPDFRGVHTSIEYPVEPQAYPGIWVDYEDSASLQIVGIRHREYSLPGADNATRNGTRWRFQGYASFTVVALTSLERDRLYDQLVRVFAFGIEGSQLQEFRDYIEGNEFVACNFDFDQVEPRGNAAAPGTPWGTDEIVYERTINMEVIGEFVSDTSSGSLIPLTAIEIAQATVDLGDYVRDDAADVAAGWQ